ncbi:MAG TPA: hypothetical protein VKX49_12620 [Bryobacteraceae bacterium]|nr:hypothetical protein [Bryobacteraceae bacterium]
MTGLDLISRSMRITGALAQGESPGNDEAVDFLQALNDLIDGLSAEEPMIYALPAAQFALTNLTGVYAMGPTAPAPFNVPRPVKIARASFIQAVTALRFDLDIINAEQYNLIPEKNNVAQVPRKLYPDYAVPNMNLSLWPYPSQGGQLELITWQAVSAVPTLQTVLVLPPAYAELLEYMLAVRIWPELNPGVPLDQGIVQQALDRKTAVMTFNRAIRLGTSEGTPPAAPPTAPITAPTAQ